jgi:hypothetical protein
MTPTHTDLTALIECIEDEPEEYARELLWLREVKAALLAACKAAIAYDRAIYRRAATGEIVENLARGAIAEGEDLDALYADWIDKARAAIAKAESTP